MPQSSEPELKTTTTAISTRLQVKVLRLVPQFMDAIAILSEANF